MLTFGQIPAWLKDLDKEALEHGRTIAAQLSSLGESRRLLRGMDASRSEEPGFYYLAGGPLKWIAGGRVVRLYSAGDWIEVDPNGAGETVRLEGDFACPLHFFPRKPFLAAVASDPQIHELWERYRQLQTRILLGLTALLSVEEIAPNFELRSFAPEAVILTEGSTSDEVYLLLQGQARVEIGAKVSGTIGANEIFGEMSFFTGRPRVATVIASENCLVQCIERDAFAKLIRSKPDLLIRVAKTLALRLSDLDRRLRDTNERE